MLYTAATKIRHLAGYAREAHQVDRRADCLNSVGALQLADYEA